MLKVWSNGRFCNVKHRTVQGSKYTSVNCFIFLGTQGSSSWSPTRTRGFWKPTSVCPLYLITYEDYRKLILSINLHAGEWWSPPICTLPFMIYWHAMYIHSLYTYLPPHPIVMIYKSRYKTNFTIFFFIIVNCYWCIIKVMLMVLPFYTKIISH